MPFFTREMMRFLELQRQGIDYQDWLERRRRHRAQRAATRAKRLAEAKKAEEEAKRREQLARDEQNKKIARIDAKIYAGKVAKIQKEEHHDRREEELDIKRVAEAEALKKKSSSVGSVASGGSIKPGAPVSAAGGGGGGEGSTVHMASLIVQDEAGGQQPLNLPTDEKGVRRLAFLRDLIKTEIERMRKVRGADSINAKEDLARKKYAVDWGAEVGRGKKCKLFSCKQADFQNTKLVAKVYMFDGQGDLGSYARTHFSPEYLKIIRFLGKKHPTIVQTWDIFAAPDRLIVIQEYAYCGTLQEYAAKTPFDEPNGGKIARGIARAVDQLGEIGISHRKICPEHVLLTKESKDAPLIPKLTGLYVSIVYWDPEKNAPMTMTGKGDIVQQSRSAIVATGDMDLAAVPSQRSTINGPSSAKADYDAPEVHSGQPYDPIVADVWSLGATIFYAFTGQYPYDPASAGGPTDGEIQFRCDQLNISAEGKDLLKWMLTLDPMNRIRINDVFNSQWMKKFT